jgi:dTDP-4-dehydrorhamnose 3,5-epimerase
VISAEADVTYKVSSVYDAAEERGIAWNDPAIGIKWPMETPILSDRDRANPSLDDVLSDLRSA